MRQRAFSSCTRHNKNSANGTGKNAADAPASTTTNARNVKKRHSPSTESTRSSIIAVAELDEEEDCICETEEDMEDEDSLFRYVCAAGVKMFEL